MFVSIINAFDRGMGRDRPHDFGFLLSYTLLFRITVASILRSNPSYFLIIITTHTLDIHMVSRDLVGEVGRHAQHF